MAILAFQKPDKVIMLEGTDTVGRFEFRPLEPGYGQTIGNALRRILLSSLEGFAISSIRITGVNQKQLGHYISGYRHPSQKTAKKIEDGVHRFSQELSAVRFV